MTELEPVDNERIAGLCVCTRDVGRDRNGTGLSPQTSCERCAGNVRKRNGPVDWSPIIVELILTGKGFSMADGVAQWGLTVSTPFPM
jgi:hypothetical protein